MAKIWVADSSIWISYLRSRKYQTFLFKTISAKTIFLPGPVLGELYTGAAARQDRRDIEMLRGAQQSNCVATTVQDWIQAGRCLALYSMRFGMLKPGDHLIDAVIAVATAKLWAVLATENLRDMKRWKNMLAKTGHRLNIETPSP